MPTARAEQPKPRRPRRDPRRERNRQNLIDAALQLVAAEGAELSVARVTRKAGMDPAGFYAHFKNIDECERAVAEAFSLYIESHVRAYETLRAVRTLEAAIDAMAALLASWLTRPEWVILLGRCRHDDTPLGNCVRDLLTAVRRDQHQVLCERAALLGLPSRYMGELEAIADRCVGLFAFSLERLVAGRADDVRREAERLVHANEAVTADALRHLLAQHGPAVQTVND